MPTIDINLNNVQETLVSGTNIKTINGESVLGSGDLDVSEDAAAIKTKYESNPNTNAFTDAEKSKLSNQSGTNTGDQDISGIATNANAITTIQGEQTTQDDAIALNTAKNSYPSADATKLAGIEAGAEVNDNAATIKTKYESNADTNAFTDAEKSTLANQSGINTGDQDISGIATNASAITTIQGEQTTQDAAIALNTAKVGITPTQAADITTNNAKRTYPLADETKLAGIEAGAQVNDNAAEIKTKYESNADTNAFTDADKTNLGNQSGTNTGDQDLSGLQDTLVSGTNIKTINGDSVLGVGNITIASLSVGTDGQIPYTNAAGDDLAYSNWLIRTDNTLTINQTADRKGIRINGYDDKSANYIAAYVDPFGNPYVYGVGTLNIASSGSMKVTSGGYFRITAPSKIQLLSDTSIGTTSYLGATLGVKGSGTTSATTSFLVENSAGADLLKVTDDGALSLLTGRLRLLNQQSSFDTSGAGNLGSIYVTDDDASFPFNSVGNLILQSRSNASRGIGFATGFPAAVSMFISGGGNVGIGVDNPTERLDIDGNLKLTGTIASDGGFANEIAVSGVGVPTWLINNTDTSMYDAQTIGRVAWKVNDANAGGVTETGAIEMEFHDNIPGGPSQGTAGEGADLVIKTGLVAVTGAGQVLTEQMRITKNGYVILANVPTSSAGLAAGTLWNNSGVINIV